jgi:NitT/TauT family transport system permease protein
MDEKKQLPKYVDFLAPVVMILFLLIIWELLVRAFDIKPVLVPGPLLVIRSLFYNFGELAPHLKDTLFTILSGFLIGSLFGVFLAAIVSNFKLANDALTPFIILLVTTPLMTLMPILCVWLGFDIRVRIIGTIIQCFPIINMNCCTGMMNVPNIRIELMQSLKANRLQRFFNVIFLSALPDVLTGLRLGSIFATTGCIAIEYIASTTGLGNRIQFYTRFYHTERAFACIFLVAIIGISLYSLLRLLERIVMRWKI